jgi:hypothetical protein
MEKHFQVAQKQAASWIWYTGQSLLILTLEYELFIVDRNRKGRNQIKNRINSSINDI